MDIERLEFGIDTFGDVTAGPDGALLPHDQVIRNLIDEAVLADEVGLDVIGIGEHHRDDFAVSAPETVLAGIATVIAAVLRERRQPRGIAPRGRQPWRSQRRPACDLRSACVVRQGAIRRHPPAALRIHLEMLDAGIPQPRVALREGRRDRPIQHPRWHGHQAAPRACACHCVRWAAKAACNGCSTDAGSAKPTAVVRWCICSKRPATTN